mmetsp:Transcript_34790/g.59078  ORF Transcript_34790/g.59078 Transcript_34790/m.59078 type:complete len:250 (-) Transcript_34790:141-890(-)
MIRQTQPRREHPIHQFLGGFHILPHGNQFGGGIVNHIQRGNARAIISQQTFETGEGDGGEVREEAVRGGGALGARSDGHEAVEVVQHRFHGPRVAVLSQHVERVGNVRRGAFVRIVRHLCRGSVGGGAELTESLELIEKFVEDVEAPFRYQIECDALLCVGGIASSDGGSFFEDEIEELTVGVPSLDAIADGGTFDRLEMTEGQLVVEGEEEGIVAAFGGDGARSGPGRVWKVLGGNLPKGRTIQGLLL